MHNNSDMERAYFAHFGATARYRIYSPYRVCPIGAHVGCCNYPDDMTFRKRADAMSAYRGYQSELL